MMNLKLKKIESLPEKMMHNSKYTILLEEFLENKLPITKLEGFKNTSEMLSARQNIHHLIRRRGLMSKLWVTVRRRELYIVNSSISGLKYELRRGKNSIFDKKFVKKVKQ